MNRSDAARTERAGACYYHDFRRPLQIDTRVSSFLAGWTLAGLIAALAVPAAAGIEVATGSMLGPRYKADRFYVRTGQSSPWSQTYQGGRYRGKAQGSLALIRLSQAVFDDDWLTERPFDPEANTDTIIEQLDLYKQHGIGGIVVSLQGDDPGYDPGANGVDRGASADLGEKAGALVSAYNADGSLKPRWMARLDRILTAANARGLIVCLVLFQQDQDEALGSREAIVAAASNLARHLIERNARNVIIDVADAWDEPEGRWDHRRFVPRFVEVLIRAVREQFQHASFSLPIGASSGSSMVYPISLARLCDVVLLQGDGRSRADKISRVRGFKDYRRPVLMVSDSSGSSSTTAELEDEAAVAKAYLESASGWTYVPRVTANQFPFDYRLAETSLLDDSWAAERRHRAYFRAVLEAVAESVLRRAPSTAVKGKKR